MDRYEEVKLRVKEANDLVTVIESYLPLKRAGRNLLALCPFHQEKTPSFTVFPDRQYFQCYGCGKGGDVYAFVMEREGVEFKEAVELLAQRVGVSTEGAFGRGRSNEGPRVDAAGVLDRVASWFQQVLQSAAGAPVRDYLESRGLAGGIDTFRLGAHPRERGALAELARRQKLPTSVLEQAGLLRGGREPFSGRLMFPIEDARGRIVGFGGRAMDDAPAKYLNSPESPWFLKRKTLYGLRQVKDAGERRVIVVEGYTDVIACHVAGVRGAVATLGTALTPDHGQTLGRYANDGVVLLFDGDRAGKAAAEKAYAELVRTELHLRAALVPDGGDPADLLAPRPGASEADQEARRQQFDALVDGAEDALGLWFRLKRGRMDLSADANVAAVVQECGRVLEGVEDPARRAILLSRMARSLGLDDGTMRASLARRRPARRADADAPPPEASAPPPREASPLDNADMELLACVLAAPELAELAAAEAAIREELRGALEAVVAAVGRGESDPAGILSGLFTRCEGDAAQGQALARSAELAQAIKDPEETFELLRRQRRAFLAKQAANRTRRELQQARAEGDGDLVNELTQRYVAQLRELNPETA
ncbi:MAG: DNA primase [Planctomycetota bacterium]